MRTEPASVAQRRKAELTELFRARLAGDRRIAEHAEETPGPDAGVADDAPGA